MTLAEHFDVETSIAELSQQLIDDGIRKEVARVNAEIDKGVDEAVLPRLIALLEGKGYTVIQPPKPGGRIRLIGKGWRGVHDSRGDKLHNRIMFADNSRGVDVRFGHEGGFYMASLSSASEYACEVVVDAEEFVIPDDPTPSISVTVQ